MKIRRILLLFAALALLSSYALVSADVIYLKDGSVINGKVIEETEHYVLIEVGKEGAKVSTKIAKEKILRIEYGDPEPEKPTEKPVPEEETGDPFEQAKKKSNAAVESFGKKDYDAFLYAMTDMMKLVENHDKFKEVYTIIEEPLKKKVPVLLEDEIKRSCNAVAHYAPFLRICPTCKGEKKTTKVENGKQKQIACSTCKGKGGIDCVTCKKRVDTAKKYRLKVRYSEDEFKHVAYFMVYHNGVATKTAEQMIQKSFQGSQRYMLNQTDDMMKMEVTLNKITVAEFLEKLLAEGMSVTESQTTPHTYVIRIK